MINLLRRLLLLLCAILLCCIFILSAGAEGDVFMLEIPNSVNVGNSFKTTVSYEGVENIRTLKLNVNYNNNYLNFKSIKPVQHCNIDSTIKTNSVIVIILFEDTIKAGDIFEIEFSARTGNEASVQKISVEINEAVDVELNMAELTGRYSAEINIVKKNQKTSSENFAADDKETYRTDSHNSYFKSNSVTSARKSVSSQRTSSSSSKTIQNVQSYYDVGSKDTSACQPIYRTDTTKQEYQYYNESDSDKIFTNSNPEHLGIEEDKSDYVVAGFLIASSFFGSLGVAYRLGKVSRPKPESDKLFNEKGSKKNSKN